METRCICPTCAKPSDNDLCVDCQTPVRPPTVFDCARLGWVTTFQQLVDEQGTAFDVNAREGEAQATVLHYAASSRRIGIYKYIFTHESLKDQVQVDARAGKDQTTPLHWAVRYNYIYGVEILYQHGADIHRRDASRLTPFLTSIRDGFPLIAAYLIAKGADVDTRVDDTYMQTALILLCTPKSFHLDTFRMLLSLRIDKDAQDSLGNTALHYAAANNLGPAVRILLDRQASTTLRNKDGKTALDLAVVKLPPKAATLRLLGDDKRLRVAASTLGLSKSTLDQYLYKTSFFIPWLLLPLFYVVLSVFNGYNVLLAELLLLCTAAGLLWIFQTGAYGDSRKAAALMFGVNVASIFWLLVSYPTFAIAANVSLGFHIALALSSIAMVFFLYKSIVVDSGTVRTTYEEKLGNIETLVESKRPVETKLCLSCLHQRPLRAKHCAELDACISRFDHYCPFVANAVGLDNHRYFFGFLFFAVTSISLETLVCWWYATQNNLFSSSEGMWHTIWSLVHYEPLLSCVMTLDILHLCWIEYLLLFNVYLLVADLTTNEVVKNENKDRVYSQGILQNAINFFRLKNAQQVDWKKLHRLEEFSASIDKHNNKDKHL